MGASANEDRGGGVAIRRVAVSRRRWEPDGWGSRARIGMLTPHNDIVPEGEFEAMAPDGVSIHVARVPLGWRSGSEPPPIGLDAVRAFATHPQVDEAAELLAATPMSVIAYAFTSSTLGCMQVRRDR